MSTRGSLVEFILLACMELRPIVAGSNALDALSFSLLVLLSIVSVSIDRFNQYDVGLGHLTLKVMLINELMLLLCLARLLCSEAFDFTQHHLLCWS